MKYIEFDEGRPLKNVHMFEKFVGGSPANIAVGVTRYGLKPGFLGKVSNDQFGDIVVDYFNSQGIDASHITRCKGGEKLGLTFTEMISPSQSGILMYRNTDSFVDSAEGEIFGLCYALRTLGVDVRYT